MNYLGSDKVLYVYERLVASFMLLVFMFAGSSSGAEMKPAVGAIRWDAWSGGNVTAQVERTLNPEKYRDRLPWFAEVLDDNSVRINGDTQKIVDREIRFAADAGLDYWAFVLYPEADTMSRSLHRYLDSEVRDQLNFCVILHNNIGVSDRDWTKERDRVIALLKEPGYQKTADGRPLVYYLSQRNERFQELREAVAQKGLNPYYVYLGWDPLGDYRTRKPQGFDAVSAYADGSVVDTFADLVQCVENKWRQSAEADIRYIPLVTTGWDKQPRKENPVSWELDHDYHKQASFPSQAKPVEIAQHLDRALKYVDANPAVCEARAILIYAWNEHDEGGWLSPTWQKSGVPDTSRLDAVQTVLRKQNTTMDWIQVSADKTQFIKKETGEPVLFWGANYDRDTKTRLMDDYWVDEWDTVVEDFDEMKDLGLNVVRIHLQVGRFMDSPTQPHAQSLEQLTRLIKAAESRGLYLYVTGLACYKKPNIPAWYDALDEEGRWAAQAVFWKHVARACASSPAVFCYDLMNEPIIPSEPVDGWLTPEGLGDCFYVQYITRTPNGRTSHAIAKAWVDHLVAAIRSEDQDHLITVGVIPWALVWADAKPLFYDPVVAENLDFTSVHFYPEAKEVEKALLALKVYAIGKPLVIAEMFPIRCSIEEMDRFIDGSKPITQGWISFYWGKTIEEYAQLQKPTIDDHITKEWLEYFKSKRTRLK